MTVKSKIQTINPAVEIDRHDLIQLRTAASGLQLKPRNSRIKSPLAGGHLSRFRGRGMDYLESRHYQPGDDVRSMDWRVTARTGAPYLKVYVEERERPVFAVIDLRRNMQFATQGFFKSVLAAKVAVLIGWAAVSQGDRFGALIMNGGHQEYQPRGGKRGVLRVIEALAATNSEAAKQQPEDDMTHSLERLRRVTRPGSLIILISDFLEMDANTERHLSELARHNNLLAIQITDPLEQNIMTPGNYGVSDGSNRAVLNIRTKQEAKDLQAYFRTRHERARSVFQTLSTPIIQLMTTDNVTQVLNHELGGRTRKRQAGIA